MTQFTLLFGSISGFLAVAFGAFGAHGLKGRVSPERLDVWNTAAHYHLVHSLVLLALTAILMTHPSPILHRASWAFMAGILVFSGSLYTLVITDIGILGAITPLGGLALMAGWAMCGWFGWSELGV